VVAQWFGTNKEHELGPKVASEPLAVSSQLLAYEGVRRVFRRNVGGLDRAVRLVLGVILLPVGLFLLGELQGHPIGPFIAAAGFVRLATCSSPTAICSAWTRCLRRRFRPTRRW
jgi:hypothetical protein